MFPSKPLGRIVYGLCSSPDNVFSIRYILISMLYLVEHTNEALFPFASEDLALRPRSLFLRSWSYKEGHGAQALTYILK